jgi:hypothetical protein
MPRWVEVVTIAAACAVRSETVVVAVIAKIGERDVACAAVAAVEFNEESRPWVTPERELELPRFDGQISYAA